MSDLGHAIDAAVLGCAGVVALYSPIGVRRVWSAARDDDAAPRAHVARAGGEVVGVSLTIAVEDTHSAPFIAVAAAQAMRAVEGVPTTARVTVTVAQIARSIE